MMTYIDQLPDAVIIVIALGLLAVGLWAGMRGIDK